MARPSLLVALWAGAAAVTTGVALASLRLVGEQVAGLPPALTPEAVASLAAAAPPTGPGSGAPPSAAPPGSPAPGGPASPGEPTDPAAPDPAATGPTDPAATVPSPADAVRTVTTAGGTLAVTCERGVPVLRYATPRAGWASDVHDGGDALEVRFRGDRSESRAEVTCESGGVEVAVEERD